MKTIKEHIKNGTFAPFYLLYGSESYLKRFYRNRLKTAIMGDGDEMNYAYFEGKGIDELEVLRLADTMPFFAEHRLLLIENSGWFKNQSRMADELKALPDTTILLFVENEVDKRNRLYKAVKELGYVCELSGMEERDLKLWVASLLKQNEKRITDGTMTYFLDKVGADMDNLSTEIEKLVSYVGERDIITADDIDAICTEQITGKIFQMVDFVASGNAQKALHLYHDLLVLREKPMTILYLLLRQFNLLMQIKQMNANHLPAATIAKNAGVPPFAVNKYLSQAKAFSMEKLLSAVTYGVSTEEQVKSGKINEQIAVEIMVVKFATL
ncbi:MAG: DNA polymerase III subunit delta [Lachnospiraceae bacterium]|nr:DNA polymerase III subunit delta [Lachnospiraceae bacterium]